MNTTRSFSPEGTPDNTPDPDASLKDIKVPGYEIVQELGRGGMGLVYKGRHTKLNRWVALKVIRSERAEDRELIRFLAEAEAVAAIKHPHVVQVYEYGEAAGRPFLALEYLTGGTLAGRLRSAGRLGTTEAASLVAKLAAAVQAAHEQGIVHRDLKPANILFDEAGEPRVADFGLAKRPSGSDLTKTQAVMGTPAYMAPEQARGKTKFVGPAADVYALGVILYECLTGSRPFDAEDIPLLLRRVAEEEPLSPRKRTPGIPRDLELVCLKCLAKEPAERYVNAGDLAADLNRFARREPVSVRPAGVIERGVKWARRRPVIAGLLAALALAGLTLIVGGIWFTVHLQAAVGDAQSARKKADDQKAEKEKELLRAEWLLFSTQISLAQAYWNEGNIAAAHAQLKACRSDSRGWEHDYLWTLFNKKQTTFREVYANDACLSPDGSRLVSSALGLTAKVWDVASGREILTFSGHKSEVFRVCFSPDGKWIVSAAFGEKTIKIWDAGSGREMFTLKGHRGSVSAMCLSTDGRRIVSGGKRLKVWDPKTGSEILSLAGHGNWVTCVCVSADGKRIASGDQNKNVKIWDGNTGKEMLTVTLKGELGFPSSVDFSRDGRWLVVAGDDREFGVFDVGTGQEKLRFKGHADRVSMAAFSPDGRQIVSGSDDTTLRLWDAFKGQADEVLTGHAGKIVSIHFSRDGQKIVSASHDGTVKIWNRSGGQALVPTEDGPPVLAVAPDGNDVLCSNTDGTLSLYDVAREKVSVRFRGHAGRVFHACFSPDGKTLASGGFDGTLRIWETGSGKELLRLKGYQIVNGRMCFSPDGRFIVCGGKAVLAPQGKLARKILGREPRPNVVELKLLDAHTGRDILTLKEHTGGVTSLSFSPDGKLIASGSIDKTVKVWDVRSGREIVTLAGHTNVVSGVCFSPDGKHVVSGSWDKTLKVWHAESGKEMMTLKGHTGTVRSVCFSPDGKRIASGGGGGSGLFESADGVVRIWDASSGHETFALKGHRIVARVCFSKDGKRLISSGEGGKTLRVWDGTLKMSNQDEANQADLN